MTVVGIKNPLFAGVLNQQNLRVYAVVLVLAGPQNVFNCKTGFVISPLFSWLTGSPVCPPLWDGCFLAVVSKIGFGYARTVWHRCFKLLGIFLFGFAGF